MAIVLTDDKINNMLGVVNEAVNQTRTSINQIEQWNSLAQNVNSILEKIISLKNKQVINPEPQQVIENKTMPIVQQPKVNIYIDNQLLKNKIISNFQKLENLPSFVKNKSLGEIIELLKQKQDMLDTYLPTIENEIKECVKWN